MGGIQVSESDDSDGQDSRSQLRRLGCQWAGFKFRVPETRNGRGIQDPSARPERVATPAVRRPLVPREGTTWRPVRAPAIAVTALTGPSRMRAGTQRLLVSINGIRGSAPRRGVRGDIPSPVWPGGLGGLPARSPSAMMPWAGRGRCSYGMPVPEATVTAALSRGLTGLCSVFEEPSPGHVMGRGACAARGAGYTDPALC